jgi:GNAT superfamily N-acetyltransferase
MVTAAMPLKPITVRLADYRHDEDARALVSLLDAYASDPAGGGGLINCIEGFSTFACRPLVNVHDVAVLASHRGHRIGERMLALVELLALERGACKLTLEVLDGNRSALTLYQRCGFAPYQLDPALGNARFLQKKLN